MISVIVPVLNESENNLIEVLDNLVDGYGIDDLEVVLVNDGSKHPDGSRCPLKSYNFPQRIKQFLTIIENMERRGVGYSIDRCAENAQGDIIVICGADVFPEKGWLRSVLNAIKDDELGCCANIGLQPDCHDVNKKGLYARYGAKILYTMTVDDLPKDSKLRKYPNYKDILEAKWLPKLADEPYEIPCVYGAFYWITKANYRRMGGFDTKVGVEWSGHRFWGCLEPMLSLKARAYGLKCMMYPDIKAGHVFGRIEDGDRANKPDYKWWNKLWVAYTLLDDDFRDELLAFPDPCYPLSLAQSYVKKNWNIIQKTRERNKGNGLLIFKNECVDDYNK